MSLVFMDSVGLLALWSESDQWHPASEKAFSEITRNQDTLLTTTFVMLECGNAVARRGFRNDANDLRERLEKSGTLIWPTEADWKLAWQNYQRSAADSAGIVDHVSFVVMRRLGIAKAFTNDRHFRAAGFETLF
ncbi:MAG: PIN domain-containing protein [Pedosphaera sp.]|nr:PIN domain-containing protein [Pedosphaera sp.]